MDAAVVIEVLAAPSVNYAMAHNDLGFLHRLVVALPSTAGGSTALEDVTVSLTLRDAQGDTLSRPWVRRVEVLAAGSPFAVDAPDLRLDAARMAEIEEETAAEVVVEVTVGGEEVGRSYVGIRVLAARQWVLDPAAPLLSLELLAGFVQPNHPAVGALVAQAAQRLAKTTGTGSLVVVDQSRERIDAIVEAVFTTLHDRGVFYAEPPASWGYGQKVRTPEDVLDGRLGTCLDTTVVLAAALEQIGIAPVLWIARGHAFVGYWRSAGQGLPEAASLQVSTAANAVDLRLMGVLETTYVTADRRPPRDLFRRAAQAPLDGYFHQNTADLVGVVDVAMARWMRVLPVPARRTRADGVVEVVDYRPPESYGARAPALAAPSRVTRARTETHPAPPRVQQWKNALLDLTLRNKLLNMTGQMTQLPLVVAGDSLGALADLLQDGRTVAVRALDDLSGAVVREGAKDAYALPGDVQRAMLANRSTVYSALAGVAHDAAITKLRYRARTTIQETGANPIYVTLARLDWTLGERELSAPLLLLPAEIRGVVKPFRIAADEVGTVTVNLSLMEKLRQEFGLVVPLLDDLPLRPSGDGVDVDAAIHAFREALVEAELGFRVETEARVAVVQFTGYLLWRDLDQHWERFCEAPLVKHLVHSPYEAFVSDETCGASSVSGPPPTLDDVVAAAPLPADGSQAEAVAAARIGRSIVLEGPPGTGKSQTITNILADQLAQGRTVLFVAEKGAALDVVRTRLGDVGLLPFTLDLHDRNARPAEVRARLRSALAQRPTVDVEGYRIAAQQVSSSATSLAAYVDRVHQRNDLGLSLYEAHDRQLARGDGPRLTVGVQSLTTGPSPVGPAAVETARIAVGQGVEILASEPLAPDHPWGFARTASDVDLDPLVQRAGVAVSRASTVVAVSGLALEAAVHASATLAELEAATWLLSWNAEQPPLLQEISSARWQQAAAELRGRTERLRADAAPVLQRFTPQALAADLEGVRQAVREAAASFFLGRRKRLLAASAPLLAHLRPGSTVEATEMADLVEYVARLAQDQATLLGSWRALPALRGLPDGLALASDEGIADLDRRVAAAQRDARMLAALPPALGRAVASARAEEAPLLPERYEDLRHAVDALRAVLEATGSTSGDQRLFTGEQGLLRRWSETQQRREADLPQGLLLRRWVGCVDALRALEATLPDARRELLHGIVGAEDAVAALDRGLADASVGERLQAGRLLPFDARAQDRTADRFVSGSGELRTQLRSVLPAAVVERRPFGAGATFGQVGALEREIGRTRGGLSVRRLVEKYGQVIAEITPCVLVSPDSLARFVPPGSIDFDLVVFDEASQIRVADAVGALGRARSVVVAGDSKQMPPSSFGEASADEEDGAEDSDFVLVHDEESILSECVQARVPRLWLSWHYRSQDESLIAFSNAQYYEGRLSSFPSVPGGDDDSGVGFVRVEGQFHRSGEKGLLRTNPVEAAAVVSEVLRRWGLRERSIGVVTFNLQQRNLIEQMLVDSGTEGVRESLESQRDGLFVKNLENVQGDERDVILFSTAFSANAAGILPLNFGPLNRSGGERRLNVAVTRARRRIIVFSSFEPEDLRAEQTSSVGIKHLRGYLEVAKHGVGAVGRPAGEGNGVDELAPLGLLPARVVDRHREDLAVALRARGLVVATSVGLSDFQVDLSLALASRPDRAVAAVLLDSPAWAARRTTGDRDGLPATVLRQIMGWPEVARVWLPAWLSDREAVLDDLVARTEAAADRPRYVGESRVSDVLVGHDLMSPDLTHPDLTHPDLTHPDLTHPDLTHPDLTHPDLTHPDLTAADPGEEYVPYPTVVLGSRSVMDGLLGGRSTERVRMLIGQIVEGEGPVGVERIARLVLASYGITRLQAPRLAEITKVIPTNLRRDDEGFRWPSGRDPLTWTAFRRSPSMKDRPLDEIALREIGNAMVFVATASMGIGPEELLKQVCRVFGGTRVTSPVSGRLDRALQVELRRGRLQLRGGVVTAG